jgi:crossover junction endodeoxyribonuclease RuvC
MARVLGIDPGTHRIGWGIVDGTPSRSVLVGCGCIELPRGTEAAQYLLKIHAEIDSLILKYRPDRVGIESLFVQKNLKTVISVAQAIGVIVFALGQHDLSWSEYSPNTIKSAVGGSGKAGKLEVERMVGLLLHIDTSKLLDDTTDALAVALTAQASK